MKVLRAFFYVLTILTLCEVMELQSLYQQNSAIAFSSDWEEPPLEEDESRGLEDDDDFPCQLPGFSISAIISAPAVTPSLYFELAEPLHEIILPPPQG